MAYTCSRREALALIPLGVADLKHEGDDVSIITHGKMVHVALQAAQMLEKEGISADVLDLRTIRPLDAEAIFATVRKTNRAVRRAATRPRTATCLRECPAGRPARASPVRPGRRAAGRGGQAGLGATLR